MSSKLKLIGLVFERLTVISEAGKDKHNAVLWNCKCSCGTEVVVRGYSLKSGKTRSCGCLKKEIVSRTRTTHGLTKHPLHVVWKSMKDRCYTETSPHFQDYGGRGITVCDRWRNSLGDFYNDVIAGYQKGLELDRKDNDGNYEPSNCRWVTSQQNSMNRRGNKNTTSKYKGVVWHKSINKWQVQIRKDGKTYYLGCFLNEADAAKVYNEKAKELFGEYAYLNKTEEFV